MHGISLALSPGNPAFGGGGASAPSPDTIAAVVEWWDFTVGATGAEITSHPGEKSVAALSQSNASYKPIWNAAGYCAWDATNDYLEFTLSSGVAAGQLWIETPYGWYKSGIGNYSATTHRIALPDATRILLVDTAALSGGDATALAAWMTGTQYGFISKTNDLTIYNRIDNNPDVNYTIEYFGANAVTYSLASSQAGATIDISAQGLTAPAHARIPVEVINDKTLNRFDCSSNQLTGSIPSLATNTALQFFYCNTNQLTGTIPSLATNTALLYFYCNANQLTGSIPSLATNTALLYFNCYTNQLTGSIPSLATNTALNRFDCSSNQLTGSIPSLATNTALLYFSCGANQLTGSIPSLATNIALQIFYCNTNQLTDWTGGTVSNTLSTFNASNNALTETAINAILAAFVAAGRATGTLILNSGTNAAPTGQGITDKATLTASGWSVSTN